MRVSRCLFNECGLNEGFDYGQTDGGRRRFVIFVFGGVVGDAFWEWAGLWRVATNSFGNCLNCCTDAIQDRGMAVVLLVWNSSDMRSKFMITTSVSPLLLVAVAVLEVASVMMITGPGLILLILSEVATLICLPALVVHDVVSMCGLAFFFCC